MPIVKLTDFNGKVTTLDFIGSLVWDFQPFGDLMNLTMY
jgi:hypothetical protein